MTKLRWTAAEEAWAIEASLTGHLPQEALKRGFKFTGTRHFSNSGREFTDREHEGFTAEDRFRHQLLSILGWVSKSAYTSTHEKARLWNIQKIPFASRGIPELITIIQERKIAAAYRLNSEYRPEQIDHICAEAEDFLTIIRVRQNGMILHVEPAPSAPRRALGATLEFIRRGLPYARAILG